MRNHFSKTQKKNQTWKKNLIFEEAQQKRKQRNEVFLIEKRRQRRIFWQKPKKIFFWLHKEFDIKKRGDNKESKKERKFNKGRENRWKEDEQKEEIKR